jgi:acyl carrier protein
LAKDDHIIDMTELDLGSFPADDRVTRILEIFAKETGVGIALLRPEATLDDLGVESLDLTMAVFQLEETFDIEIPVVVESAGGEFAKVGDLVGKVIALLDKKDAGTLSPPT